MELPRLVSTGLVLVLLENANSSCKAENNNNLLYMSIKTLDDKELYSLLQGKNGHCWSSNLSD